MATLLIPQPLRSLVGGAERLEAPGGTLAELFRNLDQYWPGFRDRILDGDHLQPGIALAVNGEGDSHPIYEPIPANAEVAIIPPIGGGVATGKRGLQHRRPPRQRPNRPPFRLASR